MRGLMVPPADDLARTMPQRGYGRNLRMADARESPLSTLLRLAIEFLYGALPTRSPTIIASPAHRGIRRMSDVAERFQNLHEFIKVAKQNLNRNNFDYIVGATETETRSEEHTSELQSH